MTKLLIVEDDPELSEQLAKCLQDQGYICEVAASGEDGMQLLNSFQFDLIVLDWNLPGITGLEVCKAYRKNGGVTPVLFLTGQSEIHQKESGLDSGADDYLVKPFEVRELTARIRSLLRRPTGLFVDQLSIDGLELEVQNRKVSHGSKNIHLMPTECALLEFFMRHPNRFYSTKDLLDAVWNSQSEASLESVRTCMKTLRHKLAKIDKSNFIKTVPGSGYIVESKGD
jgi:DNA-binding response OmpR family regulator